MSNSILFVDDEKPILRSLVRLFMQTDYKIFSAENGDYALEILKHENIDLIVSDMRMPYINGYELLNKVKKSHPNTIRLILSGYADENLIINALQDNSAIAYVFKPWVNDEMVNIISNIISVRDIMKENINLDVYNALKDTIKQLEVFNNIYTLIKNNDINAVIEKVKENKNFEQGVLNIANSAFAYKNIDSVEKVIEELGMYNFKNICLSNNILERICEKSGAESKESLLRYICTVNLFVGLIYTKVLNRRALGLHESIGLLHNLGEILNTHCLENKISKIDRSITGACLAYYLDLPYAFTEANMFSSNPMDEKVINKEVMAVLHIADKYARKLLYGEEIGFIDNKLFEFLNISEQNCRTILIDALKNTFDN